MNLWSGLKPGRNLRRRRTNSAISCKDKRNRDALVGKKGTFVVHVQCLENSTWQGEIVWAEKNESLKFRSALELLKIMDSALTTTEQGEEKGESYE